MTCRWPSGPRRSKLSTPVLNIVVCRSRTWTSSQRPPISKHARKLLRPSTSRCGVLTACVPSESQLCTVSPSFAVHGPCNALHAAVMVHRCGTGWVGQPREPEGRRCRHRPASTPAPRTPRRRPGLLDQHGSAAAHGRRDDGQRADAGSTHARQRAHLALSRGRQRDHASGAGDGCAGARPTPGMRARQMQACGWPVALSLVFSPLRACISRAC